MALEEDSIVLLRLWSLVMVEVADLEKVSLKLQDYVTYFARIQIFYASKQPTLLRYSKIYLKTYTLFYF